MEMKTVFIESKFQEKFRERSVKVATGQTRKNFFGFTVDETRVEKQMVSDGISDCEIDGEHLATELQRLLEEAGQHGFRLVSVTPLISGKWVGERFRISGGGGALVNGGGSIGEVKGEGGPSYGYSYTEGLVVVLAKG